MKSGLRPSSGDEAVRDEVAGRRRLRGLVRKEVLQILRDPSSISIAVALPLVLLLLFGYGISLDARDVPIALVVETPTPETSDFVGGFAHSPYFAVRAFSTQRDAERAMVRGEVGAIVVLRSDFSRLTRRGGAPIQLVVNGTDANTARIVQGYVGGAWQRWLAGRSAGGQIQAPLELVPRVWFNPAVNSRYFLVPGLIAIIMTLIGALLTALVVAREWERGTMESLLVTPISTGEFLLGKVIPYFVLGMLGMAVSVGMAIELFDVPFRGSFAVLFVAAGLFLLAALGMGLLISTVARNQFVAGQVAIIVTFLPAFILSGFIFDIASMPIAVRLVTYLIAARYFVAILQTLFTAGTVWAVLLPNMTALMLMAAFFMGLTWRLTRNRLE